MTRPRRRTVDHVLQLPAMLQRDRLPAIGDRWSDGSIPTEGRRALIVDVYGSSSAQPPHRLPHRIYSSYSSANLGVDVTGFSYAGTDEQGVGLPYVPGHTEDYVEIGAGYLAAYLPSAGENVVIPVGLSGGGVVALLGVAEWITSSNLAPDDLTRRVPKVILVAPAITPAPIVFQRYFERAGGQPGRIPASVRQLCHSASPEWRRMQRSIVSAFALIRWAGIPVSIIRWKRDRLTPFPWHERIQEVVRPFIRRTNASLSPVDLKLPPKDNADFEEMVVRKHLEFCDHSETVSLVRSLLQ